MTEYEVIDAILERFTLGTIRDFSAKVYARKFIPKLQHVIRADVEAAHEVLLKRIADPDVVRAIQESDRETGEALRYLHEPVDLDAVFARGKSDQEAA